jgi:Putative zinc- or iron-chelating domain
MSFNADGVTDVQPNTRRCGDCQLCCKLLPMKAEKTEHFDETVAKMVEVGLLHPEVKRRMIRDFDKPAGEKCQFQKHGVGCRIYARRPFGCRFWSCVWLSDPQATADLSRPDRSHYVVDMAPDFVEHIDDATGERVPIPAVQVWVDPKYPDAHRDPHLRTYLDRRGKEGYCALIRYDAGRGFVLFPPSMTGGEWIEKTENLSNRPEHTIEEKTAALGDMEIVFGQQTGS